MICGYIIRNIISIPVPPSSSPKEAWADNKSEVGEEQIIENGSTGGDAPQEHPEPPAAAAPTNSKTCIIL